MEVSHSSVSKEKLLEKDVLRYSGYICIIFFHFCWGGRVYPVPVV